MHTCELIVSIFEIRLQAKYVGISTYPTLCNTKPVLVLDFYVVNFRNVGDRTNNSYATVFRNCKGFFPPPECTKNKSGNVGGGKQIIHDFQEFCLKKLFI